MKAELVDQKRDIKSGMLFRTASIDRSAVDEKARTIEVAFSSEAPVERWFGMEVLGHDKKNADLSRIKSRSAPLLVNHDVREHVGIVEEAHIDGDKKGRAVVRFGKSARAEEIFQDVLDGIRTGISFGYRVHEMVTESVKDGVETLRAVNWSVHEISLASIPADASVGVGRSTDTTEENTITITPKQVLPSEPVVRSNDMKLTTPLFDAKATEGGGGTTTTVTAADVRRDELRRMNEINAIAKRFPQLGQIAEQALANGTSADEFRRSAFETMNPGAKPIDLPAPELGLSKKELKRYSLVRALRTLAEGRALDGLEGEASAEMFKRTEERIKRHLGARGLVLPDERVTDPEGFMRRSLYVPHDVLMEKRDLSAASLGAGGAFVQTDLLSGNMIELLRNKMVTNQLGATFIDGLVGDVAIPSQTGGATAYWLSETGTLTVSAQTTGQLTLTPHRLAAATAYSLSLLAQSSIDVENFVRSDLMTVTALERDRAAIQGSGAGAEPQGIYNASGLSTGVTFASQAAPTFAELVSFETNVATSNADIGRLAYLVNPAARGKLKTTPKAANQAIFIWENNSINGYTAVCSNQVPTGQNVCFGNWADCVQASWAGVVVTVNPYSLDLQSQVRIVVQMLCDTGLRHAASFSVSANSIT
jgi:HK97 family phage major capsid protein